MAIVREWVRRLWGSLAGSRRDRDLEEELKTHLAFAEEDALRHASSSDPVRAARVKSGGVVQAMDALRDQRGLRWLDDLAQDVRYGLRLLRRSPAFTLVALLSLGLGIGANTAIFSLIDTVLVKSLPVDDPDRLFFIDNSGGKSGGSSGPPYPCYERLRDHNRFLSSIAAFDEARLKVTIDGAPEELRGQYASGSYFDLLGVRAIHGRVLTPVDDSQYGVGGPDGAVAVISYSLWKQRFGMDPGVLGKIVHVGTKAVTIVGVTEPEFFGLQIGSPVDITIPMALTDNNLGATRLWWFSVVGRLKPDASVEQARADIEAIWDAYLTDVGMPRDERGYFSGIAMVPANKGLNALRREFSEPLLIVMGIVAVVLLVGCANVANLLLARASARHNEIAVRLATGASRSRLLRQLLTEGAVLAVLGTITGIVFARWSLWSIASQLATTGEGVFVDLTLDRRVLAFTTIVAVVTGLLFSLAPALRAVRTDAAKPGAATNTSATKPRALLRQSLVVVQVTLSLVLLCGAAVFLRTLHNLRLVDAGFDREGVLTLQVDATIPRPRTAPPSDDNRRREHARLGAIWEQLALRTISTPGVTSAAVATMVPLTGRDRGVLIAVSGVSSLSEKDRYIHINQVTAGYFETMGIRVTAGRPFTHRDRAGSLRVVILNELAARAYFGATNPIGARINFPGQRVEDEYEIVGVVRDARYEDFRTPDERMAYVPIEQSIDPITGAIMVVRPSADVTRVMLPIREAVADTVPGGFITRVATIEQRIASSLIRERLLTVLATFFAMLALVLACIGLYGVLAYGVIRRTREIGIRIAIGARQRSVIWMVVREALSLVSIGAALGLAGSFAAGRFINSQLFEVSPADPAATVLAIFVLLVLTAIACGIPARRASRIHPVTALRYE
jgi:predicted permease